MSLTGLIIAIIIMQQWPYTQCASIVLMLGTARYKHFYVPSQDLVLLFLLL